MRVRSGRRPRRAWRSSRTYWASLWSRSMHPGHDFRRPASSDELDALWDRVRTEPRSTEVVWLANGDRLAGGFLGLDDKRSRSRSVASPSRSIARAVRCPRFRPGAGQLSSAQSGFLELTLKDGSRLGVTEARLDDGTRSGHDAIRGHDQVFR